MEIFIIVRLSLECLKTSARITTSIRMYGSLKYKNGAQYTFTLLRTDTSKSNGSITIGAIRSMLIPAMLSMSSMFPMTSIQYPRISANIYRREVCGECSVVLSDRHEISSVHRLLSMFRRRILTELRSKNSWSMGRSEK